MAVSRKEILKDWEVFKLNLLKETSVAFETETEKRQRISRLQKKGNYEEFFKYYFPNYYLSEPAYFHKRASKRFIETDTIYEVRAWSRELAKSARSMMEVIYLTLTGKIKNILLISATEDSAKNLLIPFKLNFEFNNRIINDFGNQRGYSWTDGNFITSQGVSFLAVGAGQSPRGTRNEAIRPDCIIFDDIDTDEEIRNPDRIQKKWDWIEKAVMPTVSVSKHKKFLFLGNIIGKDTCITRAGKVADIYEIINIRNKDGESVWKRNTEAQIDWLLSKMSYRSGQQEYFNNPLSGGTIFKDILWASLPDIRNFKFLVKYGDPSYSNNTKKKNSSKFVGVIGEHQGKFYIFDCRLDKVTNSKFVSWYFDLDENIKKNIQVYNYIENNSLQDPFWQQVLKPEFSSQAISKGETMNMSLDTRKKPEKFFRCEGNLEPLHRDGKIIFDIKQKDNPHMKKLAEQFEDFSENNMGDGVDGVEGGIWIIQNKLKKSGKIHTRTKTKKNKRY